MTADIATSGSENYARFWGCFKGMALTGQGYDDLGIQEGGTASNEFLRVTFGDVEEKEQRKVRQQLLEYCGRDTEGMIWIVEKLGRG